MTPAGPSIALLRVVFFLSGLSSLVYQVIWQRLLTVHYGVGTVSTTLVVSVTMFGLGLGAWLGGLLAERVASRVRAYVVVELAMALFGAISPALLSALGRATAGVDQGLSLACFFGFLCLPTLLMGATLPLVTKLASGRGVDFVENVGFLYFVNTLGAAAGALVTSYLLISFLGLDRPVYGAALVNLGLAIAVGAAGRGSTNAPATAPSRVLAPPAGLVPLALALFAGFMAIGYELIWFRVIGVLVKASPYAFPTVLSVVLTGIAVGSFAMTRWMRSRPSHDGRRLFLYLQAAMGLSVALSVATYVAATHHTPFAVLTGISFRTLLHPNYPLPDSTSLRQLFGHLFSAADLFVWPAFFALVPTLLMGASFPLLSSLAHRAGREGETVGRVYAANVAGNVLGGLSTGFVLLPLLGTERTLAIFVSGQALMGIGALGSSAGGDWRRPVFAAAVAVLVLALLPGPGELYATIHSVPRPAGRSHVTEGRDGVVVSFEDGERVVAYINGHPHGGRPLPGFALRAAETVGHARRVNEVLVIGFGTGSIVEALLGLDEVERIQLVEVNETLIRNLREVDVLRRILDDPRVELVLDDGRRFLHRATRRYDLVLIDALTSTTAYSNNIYSREFFELVRERLAPGGVFFAWFDEEHVIPKTARAVFPELRWYAEFLLASNAQFESHPERARALLAALPAGLRSRAADVAIRYRGRGEAIDSFAAGYPVNTDWRPVAEYYLGLRVRQTLGWIGMPRGDLPNVALGGE